jgi:hypothetical protein
MRKILITLVAALATLVPSAATPPPGPCLL